MIASQKRIVMKFELEDEYIELYKLLKVMGLSDSGAHAKMLIEDGQVKRNGEVELRKRCKIVSGEKIELADEFIDVESIKK